MRPSPLARERGRSPCALAALVLLCGVPAAAGSRYAHDVGASAADERPFRAEWWTRREGLPQASVTAIAQTRDGYLWFGTFGGLVRFDGVRMEVISPRTHAGLSSNRITALCAARDGSLWIGTEDRQAFRFAGGRFEHVALAVPDAVEHIVEAEDGSIWLGSHGLTRWTPAGATYLDFGLSREESYVTGLLAGAGNRVWVTMQGLAYELADGAPTRLAEGGVVGFVPGADGMPVVLVRPGSRAQGAPQRSFDAGLYGSPRRAWTDAEGRAWIATTSGLWLLPPGSGEPESARLTARPQVCRAVLEDREGNLWVGFDLEGACRLRPAPGVRALEIGAVRSVVDDGQGGLLLRHGNGIDRLLADGRLTRTEIQGPGAARIEELLCDARGALWMRGKELLTRRDGAGSVSWPLASTGIAQDAAGTVWLGAQGGLVEMGSDGPAPRPLPLAPDVAVELPTFDQGGALWFASRGEGAVFRWAEGTLARHDLPEGARGVALRDLALGADGTLWIATYGAGLGRLRDGRIAFVDTSRGLLDDYLGHLATVEGTLWANSNRGVFAISEAALHACLDGRPNSRLVCYQACDAEGNGAGGCRTADGTLWFPTVSGVVAVDPVIRRNEVAPQIHVERVLANGVEHPLGAEGIQVAPGSGDLEIAYAGLSFTDPHRVRFCYRLSALASDREEPWVYAGSRRTAYFTNLRPGSYGFEVRACNNDGVWSAAPATVRLRLEPRFWQTGWFAALLALGALGAIGGLHELRMAGVRRRNRALDDEVAAHQRTVAALREREATHRALAETATDGILIVDDARRVAYANAAARALLRLGAAGDVSAPLGRFLADDPAGRARVAQLFEGGGRRALPLEGCRSDAQPFAVEVSSGSMRRADGREAFVLILRDVTERQRLERQLAEAGKMEAVARLSGGIAHDFNNILTGLLGHAALLDEEIGAGRDQDFVRGLVEQVRRGAERAARLVRQLLTFARRRVVDPGIVDPNRTVRELEPMLRTLIPASIRLRLELEPDVGLVHVDACELEQALVNLVANAKDAIDGAGTIVVGTRRELFAAPAADAPAPAPHVALRVVDDGRGIPAAQQSRIFEPFFTTKPVGGGTGLGLASAYGFAEQAGGALSVDSAPGQGSCFTIHLPVVATPLAAPAVLDREIPGPQPSGALTVLLCDDDQPVLDTAAAILRRAGHRVVAANGPEEALRAFDEIGGAVDALVTDIVMPVMDGRELAAQLRARRADLPVLFVSGYAPDALGLRGDDPLSDFLAKPFPPRELLAALARCARGHAAGAPPERRPRAGESPPRPVSHSR